MKKEEILKELNNAFSKFKFFENDHHYEVNGKRVGISVTRLIEQYAQEFNADEVAGRVAIRDRKTKEEVLNEWKYKNKFACEKGSKVHDYTQALWKIGYEFPISVEYASDDLKNTLNIVSLQSVNFYKDYKNILEHVADEYVIGSEEYDIASAVDHLFIDKKTNTLLLIDYKTNTYITGWNKKSYKKSMKAPLDNLNDDKLTHYQLQLSIYKYIIEKYTNLKIADMIIVYMSEVNKNYELIRIPYLKKEVKEILEWRKWE